MKFSLFLILITHFSATSLASTRYVTDVLYVPIRSGASMGHKVLATMKTGEKITILDDDVENGFVEVQNSRGLSGYMPIRYLVEEPVAASQLASMKNQVAKMKQKMEKQVASMQDARENLKTKSSKTKALSDDNKRLKEQLAKITAISGDAIAVAAERDQLKERVRRLEQDNGGLLAKNQALLADNQNEGIKLGIGAVMLGIILGFVAPYLKPRRRSAHHMMRLR